MHRSRLDSELQRLFLTRRTAALATLDDELIPHVSLVPYAVDPGCARLVILVSGLAAHTIHMQRRADVSVLLSEGEAVGEPVHALSRLTLHAQAEEDASRQAAAVYLARFPEAEEIAQLPDFRYFLLKVRSARQVAGFGAARDLSAEAVERLVRTLG